MGLQAVLDYSLCRVLESVAECVAARVAARQTAGRRKPHGQLLIQVRQKKRGVWNVKISRAGNGDWRCTGVSCGPTAVFVTTKAKPKQQSEDKASGGEQAALQTPSPLLVEIDESAKCAPAYRVQPEAADEADAWVPSLPEER